MFKPAPKKILDTVNYYDPKTGDLMQKQIEVLVRDLPVTDEVVKIGGGKTVVIQCGPTPGDAFAVYAQNPQFHGEAPEEWNAIAKTALGVWAAKGNLNVVSISGDPGRLLNWRLEYRV